MPLPNFLIVGAPKAGTTSLFAYLGQHPEVYVPPVKEPCFFSSGLPSFTHDLSEYERLFAGVTNEKAVGEASTPYLYDPDAALRIHNLLPHAKIIIMLRDPVERAYSEWAYNAFQLACEPLSFEAALDAEDERAASESFRKKYTVIHFSSFLYFRVGLYHEQVGRYLDLFGQGQVRIHLFEDFVRDPAGICQDLFRFLGVNPDFLPRFEVHNPPRKVRSPRLQRLLVLPPEPVLTVYRLLPAGLRATVHRIARKMFAANLAPAEKPRLNPDTAQRLRQRYENSISALEKLLRRDLTIWKKGTNTWKPEEVDDGSWG